MSSCSSDTISLLPKMWVILVLIRVVHLLSLCFHLRKFLAIPRWVSWIQTPSLLVNFQSVLLLAWEEGWWLPHLCFMAVGNTKVTGSNPLSQELEVVLGPSWQRQQSHSQRHLPAVSLSVPSTKRSPSLECTIFCFSLLKNVTIGRS